MGLKGRVAAGVLALAMPCVLFFEGTVHKTYVDAVGVLTACTGHTGRDVKPGMTFTQAQCDELLAGDLESHDADIGKCIKVPVADHERAAYLSFAFNVGATAFCGSTMLKKLNAGDHVGACNELLRWVYAGGRELAGLVKRRQRERTMCLGNV